MKTAVNDSYPKLLTLKDLPERALSSWMQKTATPIGIYEFKRMVKKEAIEWWKERFDCGESVCCTCEEMWQEFFNITEDDLK